MLEAIRSRPDSPPPHKKRKFSCVSFLNTAKGIKLKQSPLLCFFPDQRVEPFNLFYCLTVRAKFPVSQAMGKVQRIDEIDMNKSLPSRPPCWCSRAEKKCTTSSRGADWDYWERKGELNLLTPPQWRSWAAVAPGTTFLGEQNFMFQLKPGVRDSEASQQHFPWGGALVAFRECNTCFSPGSVNPPYTTAPL